MSEILEVLGDNTGYEKLAPTTSTGFTTTLIRPTSGTYQNMTAKAVLIGVETQPIRFRCDGTAPTADEGMYLAANNYYTIVGEQNIRNFHCIDTSAGASSVKCLFFH
jgi:hypothetical protein